MLFFLSWISNCLDFTLSVFADFSDGLIQTRQEFTCFEVFWRLIWCPVNESDHCADQKASLIRNTQSAFIKFSRCSIFFPFPLSQSQSYTTLQLSFPIPNISMLKLEPESISHHSVNFGDFAPMLLKTTLHQLQCCLKQTDLASVNMFHCNSRR